MLIAERRVILPPDFCAGSIGHRLDRPKVIAVVDEESGADLFAADEIFSNRAIRRDLVIAVHVPGCVAPGDLLETIAGSAIRELDATD
jgi:hypothetical protein